MILIKGARVIDGSGSDGYVSDILMHGGAFVGIEPNIEAQPGWDVVDAEGLTAVPGFIDMHRHADLLPFGNDSGIELLQGLTTVFTGMCGFSAAPSSEAQFQKLRDYSRPIIGEIPIALGGMSFGDMLQRAEPCSVNVGTAVGSGAVRIAVKGFDPAPLTRRELDEALGHIDEALSNGAFALSMGLMYSPENYYLGGELLRLFGVAARHNRPTIVHMRGEGSSLIRSLDEVISLAERSGAPLHISHLKAAGRRNWGQVSDALERISLARARGLDVTFDAYPYNAGSTALHTLFPPRLLAGGIGALLERLSDGGMRARLVDDLREEQLEWDNLIASTGWQSVIIAGADDASLIGRSVAEISESRGTCPELCAMDLLIENGGNVPMVFYSMDIQDVRNVLTTPGAILISDSLYGGGLPHPRKFGSQAALINSGWLRVEDAVRMITALPATRMGLTDRGTIRLGMTADLLLLDMAQYSDTATYSAPEKLPTGIRRAYISGKLCAQDGAITNWHGGSILIRRD